jgi:hypothetical protein
VPGQSDKIKIEVSGNKEFESDLQDDLQGGYIKTVIIPKDEPRPTVSVSYTDVQFPDRILKERTIRIKIVLLLILLIGLLILLYLKFRKGH